MMRVGVVGAGFAANLHAEGLVDTGRAEVVGVVSATELSRRTFAKRWNCTPYVDIAAMLEHARPDAITLAMPNRFHHDATLAAARAGVHVICEKPLAMNLGEADRMIEACRAAGVHLPRAVSARVPPGPAGDQFAHPGRKPRPRPA